MSEFSHKSIMLQQCIDGLAIKPDGIYVDGTCGGAGHSREIAKHLASGKRGFPQVCGENPPLWNVFPPNMTQQRGLYR